MADDDLQVSFGAKTAELDDAVNRSRSLIQQFSDSIKAAFAKLDTAQAQKSFNDVGDAAQSSAAKVQSSYSEKVVGIGKEVADTFGVVGATVVAIGASFVTAGQAAERLVGPIRAAAGAFDQSTESMSAISLIAQRSGLSLQELGVSFHDLQTKAASGDKDMVAALNAIGLKASEVATLSQEQLAVKLAGAFSTARDSANKSADGVALFGSTVAGKLVPQLDLGAARMTDLAGLASRVGLSFNSEFAARVQGTASMFQIAQDRIQELNLAIAALKDDFSVGFFNQTKAALDGLVQTFSDVTRNVAQVVEYFGRLIGASDQSTASFGLLHTAANLFADAVIEVVNRIQVFAVECVQYIAEVGISFGGLQKVALAFGEDIEKMASASANALYAAFHESISGIITLFGDLAQAGKNALSFDLSGVGTAFSKFGTDAQSTTDKIRTALSPELFGGTKAAITEMQQGAQAYARSLDQVIAKLQDQKKAELDTVAAGGARGTGVQQTRAVGDPSAPDTSGDAEKLEAALRELDGEVQAVKAAEKQKEELLTAGVRLKQITEDQKAAAVQKSLADELAQENAIYQRELALDGLKATQRQEILNKMAQAQQQYTQAVLRMQLEAAERTQQAWDQAFDKINSAFSGQIDGLLRGTTTFGRAFKNILTGMIEDVTKFLVQWALKHAETIAENIAGVNAQTAAQIAGASAGTAAQTAGAATSSIAILSGIVKNITASAAETFAGIFGFLSPILGPAAAAPAAAGEATVLGAIPALATGAWQLPGDMVAQLHQGEMVVPATFASSLRSAVGGGGGGGDITHNHNWNIAVNGARAPAAVVSEIRDNVRQIIKELNGGYDVNQSLRPWK